MNFTRKTYYGMCILSAALSIIQGALIAFKLNASAIGSVSMIFYGLAMLLIAANAKNDKPVIFLCLLSAVLLIVGLISTYFMLGLFAWPCFAVHSVNHKAKNIQIASKLVIGGALVLLFAGFFTLPMLFATMLYLIVSCLQIHYAFTLFKGEHA